MTLNISIFVFCAYKLFNSDTPVVIMSTVKIKLEFLKNSVLSPSEHDKDILCVSGENPDRKYI